MIPLRFETWEPIYKEIVAEFGFDAKADARAAEGLAKAIARPPFDPSAGWKQLRSSLGGHRVTVLGAADDGPDRLRRLLPVERLVAADGATTAALEAGRRPDLIVSDLDGDVEDEVRAVRDGAFIAIHAHGDNVSAVRKWLPRFEPSRVVGTCQTRPVPPLVNAGGFTDGDRACFLAHELGSTELYLVGFSFDGKIGRYSGTYDPATKPRKLAWSKRLIETLSKQGASVRWM